MLIYDIFLDLEVFALIFITFNVKGSPHPTQFP